MTASQPTTARAWHGFALPMVMAAALIAADQGTKWLVVRSLGPAQSNHRTELLGSALAIHYVENTGAAFGMFRGQSLLLSVVALVVVLALTISYARVPHPSLPLALGLGLLVGGAVGNLVDRYRLGYVVDFIAVAVWPKFNLADAAITVGIALLALHLFRAEQPDFGEPIPSTDNVAASPQQTTRTTASRHSVMDTEG